MGRPWMMKRRRLVKKIELTGLVDALTVERIKERVFFDDGEGSWVDGNGRFVERVVVEARKHWRVKRKENLEKLMKKIGERP